MEFWRYYRIIRKRRWLILLGIIVCVGYVVFSNYRAVPEFVGRTTLMESKGMSREGIPLFPEPYAQMDQQLRLSNLSSIAMSQKVMQRAADVLADLGLEYAPNEILANTKVEPVKDTNIIAIEVTLPNGDAAGNAADVIASEFKKVYGELNNDAVKQSREFIEAQLETTREAMIKAQNDLKDYKQAHGIVQLDQQSVAAISRLSQSKVDQSGAAVSYQAAKARRQQLDKELASMPEWETANKQTSRDPVWQRLSDQLSELENSKAEQSITRGPNHPAIKAIDNQIAEVREKLKSTAEEYLAATTVSKNANRVNAVSMWIQAKVDETGANAQRQAIGNVINSMSGELAELPEKEAKLAELQTNVKAATDTYGLMRSKLDEAKITEQQAQNEVSLKTVDPAYVYPVSAKKSLKLVLAFLLGPLFGILAAFALHYTDNTIKTAQEAEKALGLPVLTVVPGTRAHSLARQQCPEVMDVAYQMLTSNLWIFSQNQGVNSMVVVSADPDAGRSITASNMAVSLAKEGARVVLVDSDLRKPTQHLIFGADNKVGLTNLLGGGASLEDVLVPTKVQGLLLVPSGPIPDNPVKLLKSAEMYEFANQVKDVADFVIYDTPAGVTFPDPILIASQVGSAVVVQAAGRVTRGSEAELNVRLESVGVRLIGAVLNKVKKEDSSSYFHYHRSYQGVETAQLPSGKKSITHK